MRSCSASSDMVMMSDCDFWIRIIVRWSKFVNSRVRALLNRIANSCLQEIYRNKTHLLQHCLPSFPDIRHSHSSGLDCHCMLDLSVATDFGSLDQGQHCSACPSCTEMPYLLEGFQWSENQLQVPRCCLQSPVPPSKLLKSSEWAAWSLLVTPLWKTRPISNSDRACLIFGTNTEPDFTLPQCCPIIVSHSICFIRTVRFSGARGSHKFGV